MDGIRGNMDDVKIFCYTIFVMERKGFDENVHRKREWDDTKMENCISWNCSITSFVYYFKDVVFNKKHLVATISNTIIYYEEKTRLSSIGINTNIYMVFYNLSMFLFRNYNCCIMFDDEFISAIFSCFFIYE